MPNNSQDERIACRDALLSRIEQNSKENAHCHNDLKERIANERIARIKRMYELNLALSTKIVELNTIITPMKTLMWAILTAIVMAILTAGFKILFK